MVVFCNLLMKDLGNQNLSENKEQFLRRNFRRVSKLFVASVIFLFAILWRIIICFWTTFYFTFRRNGIGEVNNFPTDQVHHTFCNPLPSHFTSTNLPTHPTSPPVSTFNDVKNATRKVFGKNWIQKYDEKIWHKISSEKVSLFFLAKHFIAFLARKNEMFSKDPLCLIFPQAFGNRPETPLSWLC